MKKENKGITLVALVITIIVLIILAGVSINSVMSDGLIDNAKEAKNECEEAKGEEEVVVTNFQAETDFAVKKVYSYYNGYITGVKVDNEAGVETAGSFRSNLPNGYEVYNTDGESEIGDDVKISTGMVVKKINEEGKKTEVGKIVVFGEFNGTAGINRAEQLLMTNFLYKTTEMTEIQKRAADINHDGYFDQKDQTLFNEIFSKAKFLNDINQDAEPKVPTVVYNESEEVTENEVNETTDNTITE